ncbi:MAG TPA: TMEM165/GDT1 family protein [Candidatus Limnocylindria bacterium]|nr:TMEM165/GDT1 family protein [Candidatus Limnocylindria bacterium]
MPPLLAAVAVAFGALFIAEFGDKSQLLVLAFAARHAWAPVVVGILIAAFAVQGLSVAVGAALGAALPETLISVVAGLAFLGVAAWTLVDSDDDDATTEADVAAPPASRTWLAVVAVVAGTFIVSELGDKTMLATFALAARQDPVGTWIGGGAGMVAANLVAVVVGNRLGARLEPRLIRFGSAALFAIAGIVVLAGALLGG